MNVDEWDAYVDRYGHEPGLGYDGSSMEEMGEPVRCTCGRVYDLFRVEVTARYADCSMWKAPCCGRTADDRGETGWKSTKDYTPLRGRTSR